METVTPPAPPFPAVSDAPVAPSPLRQELEAARGTISVLMDRIEKLTSAAPAANVLNLNALALQQIVRQRTKSLEQMNEGLIQAATQRKRIDRILREMQRIADIGGWELEVASGAIELTEQIQSLLGLPSGANFDTTSLCDCFIHADAQRLRHHIQAVHLHGHAFDLELQAAAGQDKIFRVVGHPLVEGTQVAKVYGVIQDITLRKQGEVQLEHTNQRLLEISRKHELILNSITEGIHWIGRDGNIVFENPASVRLLGWKVEDLIGKPAHATMHHSHPDGAPYPKCDCHIYQGMQTGLPSRINNEVFWRKDGTSIPVEYSNTPVRDETGEIVGTVVVFSDITQRKQAEAQLEQTHKQLIDVSRQAGMAEVATGVLHNVGNVLNSVNISSSIVADNLKKSKISNLIKIADLLREHDADLGTFISTDPKGKLLPAFIRQLADHLLAEKSEAVRELEQLQKNIEHIKEIVSTQQIYASAAGLNEPLDVRELLEDALRINSASLTRHGVTVVRNFADTPIVPADRHKVLQILVNLIRNARHAMLDSPEKTLTLATAFLTDGTVQVSVRDTGCGIAPENMTRIFAHGFTTKKDGHGFGLHSSALAAKEMKGSLAMHSDGPGKGALFTLQLPSHAPATSK